MKQILIALFFAAQLLGAGTYMVTRTATLSNGAETVTAHLPSTATSSVKFDGVSIYSSASCTFTVERDGAVPTTTATTVVKINAQDGAAQAVVFHTSNVGSGTTIGTVVVSGSTGLDYRDKGLVPGENLSVKTTGCTATITIIVKWYE